MYVCTAVNALSVKIWINHETKTFSRLFHPHSHKIYLVALLGIFTDQTERFSIHETQLVNPNPFLYLKP